MSNTKGGIILFLSATMVGIFFWYMYSVGKRSTTEVPVDVLVSQLPDSPAFASYQIEGKEVQLVDGYAEHEATGDTTGTTVTQVHGEVVDGQLTKNSQGDAVVLLQRSESGGDTKYYVAAAIGSEEGYLGSNAIFLGENIEQVSLSIKADVVLVEYRAVGSDEGSDEKLLQRYFTVSGVTLKEVGPLEEYEALFEGELVYGHESHTFTPCGGEAVWIAPNSRAKAAIQAVYEESTKEAAPYTPIFMVLTGTEVAPPAEGFGAEYEQAISVTRVVQVPQNTVCTKDEPAVMSEEVFG